MNQTTNIDFNVLIEETSLAYWHQVGYSRLAIFFAPEFKQRALETSEIKVFDFSATKQKMNQQKKQIKAHFKDVEFTSLLLSTIPATVALQELINDVHNCLGLQKSSERSRAIRQSSLFKIVAFQAEVESLTSLIVDIFQDRISGVSEGHPLVRIYAAHKYLLRLLESCASLVMFIESEEQEGVGKNHVAQVLKNLATIRSYATEVFIKPGAGARATRIISGHLGLE